MTFQRRVLTLRGEAGLGVLIFEGQSYSLVGRNEGGRLMVFDSEFTCADLGEALSGTFLTPSAERILAAAIVGNHTIKMKGAFLDTFDWNMARATLGRKEDITSQNAEEAEETAIVREESLPPKRETSIENPGRPAQNEAQTDLWAEQEAAYISPKVRSRIPEDSDCALAMPCVEIEPFAGAFGESHWKKAECPLSNWHYLTGELYRNGSLWATAVAVPGQYAPAAPPWLEGFSRYETARAGAEGYWVRIDEIRQK